LEPISFLLDFGMVKKQKMIYIYKLIICPQASEWLLLVPLHTHTPEMVIKKKKRHYLIKREVGIKIR
jgi:hypothetical protein